MDRRLFLKRGLMGGALLALFGGGVLGFRQGEYPDVGARELRVLDEPTFWILAAVAARTTPAQGELAATIAHSVDVALRTAPPRAQKDFVRVLYLLENALAGLAFHGSTTVFTELSETAQGEALYAWRDSSVGLLRGAYHSLRRLTLGAYYANAERAAEVGYGGPLWAKPAPPKITDAGPLSPPYVVVAPTAEVPADGSAPEQTGVDTATDTDAAKAAP
jgi:hypothetical protein